MRPGCGARISSRVARNSVLNGPAPIRSPSSSWSSTPASSKRRPSSSSIGLTARGPTVDVAVKVETAPDGEGSSLKLGIDAGPSATSDLIRLWPQFINPDVREWCAHNLHGGRIQGSMKANWTAADLDAMAHKRGLPRESLHGEFTTRDVSVDLLPGLPPMMTDEGSGSFTGHEFTVSGNRATMVLSPSRRVQANDLVFTVPDTTPRPIVDASAQAHMTGTADSLADLLMREPLRRQAGLTIDPATVKGQAEGNLVLDLKLGKTARPEDTQFHATGALDNLQIEKFIADEKLESATAAFEADRNTLKIVGDGELLGAPTHVEVARAPGEEGSATVTFALDAAARAKRGLNFGSWLTGSLPIKLKAPLTRASAEVEIDLTPAGVDNPIPGLSKPAGKAGKATFVVKPTPEGALLSNIVDRHGRADDARLGSNGRRRRACRAPRSPKRASRPATISGSTSSIVRLRFMLRCAARRSTRAPSSSRCGKGPRPRRARRRTSTSTPRSRASWAPTNRR